MRKNIKPKSRKNALYVGHIPDTPDDEINDISEVTIKAGIARTATVLNMFEPIMLPTTISCCFFIALVIETANSGTLVPRATIVRPIIKSGTPCILLAHSIAMYKV